MAKQYVVYDHRAADGDSDAANVLCCAGSIEEARRDIREMFGSGCIYEYDVVERHGRNDDELINERLVEVWDGGKRCEKRDALIQAQEGGNS